MSETKQPKRIAVTMTHDISNPQPEWDKKVFEDGVWDKGYACYTDKAIKCPCANKSTGAALTSCENCGGSGWVFVDRKSTILLAHSLSNKTKYDTWTEQNAGTASITARSSDRLAYMDRVVFTELETYYTEVRRLYLAASDPTKYFTFLIYEPIEIEYLFLFKNVSSPLIKISKDNFTIDRNKIVFSKQFLDSQLQQKERDYPNISIRYFHNPVYHIIDINREMIKQKTKVQNCDLSLNINKVDYPTNYIGRRAHYIMDAPAFTGERIFDNSNYL